MPYNPSPYDQWLGGQAGQEYAWEDVFNPSNWAGDSYFNPYTNDEFNITPEMRIRQGQNEQNMSDAGYVAHGWVNPGKYKGLEINGQNFFGMDSSGNWNFNFDAMNMGGGDGAAGGYMGKGGGYTPWTGGSYSGPTMTAPAGYEVKDFGQEMIDVTDLINAEAKLSDTRRADAWADAASRFGQSGAVASTPYMNQLADVAAEEEARKDQIFGTLRMQTGMDYAQRQLQEEMQQRQLEEQAWATRGGWDMMAQQGNAGNSLQAWMANENNRFGAWNSQNQLGFQDYWNQQSQSQDQDSQMMDYMMSMIGGVMP